MIELSQEVTQKRIIKSNNSSVGQLCSHLMGIDREGIIWQQLQINILTRSLKKLNLMFDISKALFFVILNQVWLYGTKIDNYQNIVMKLCSVLALILVAIQCSIYYRLDSNGVKTMNAEDSLTSTFGTFRLTLKQENCKLSVQKFDATQRKYIVVGNHLASNFNANCKNLTITNGSILTDSNFTYMLVPNANSNYSTQFTIDDEGVIRLIATSQGALLRKYQSSETVISQFKIQSKYVKSFSNLFVAFGDRFAAFANERNWKFIAQFGQLTIYYGPNPAFKIDYIYSQFSIVGERIFTFNGDTFPGTLLTNITFQPRCSQPKQYIEFRAPYVFVADPYWPQVSVYDQGGYKIIELSYSKLSQRNFDQDRTQIYYHNFFSHCPRRTFQLNGGCYANCPSPYYHQIKGDAGKCVLVCEEFAKINETDRTCGCMTEYEQDKISSSDLVIGCPAKSVKTPYGCKCTSANQYYDGQLSFRCIQNCPIRTYGDDGLCMKCPDKCLVCSIDSYNRLYLECTSCEEGYEIYIGQCIPKCNNNLAESVVNGVCQPCKDKFCVDCSGNPDFCLKCDIMKTLNNGTCVDKCNSLAQSVYSEYFSTKCLNRTQSCYKYLESHYKNTAYLKCDECLPNKFMHLDQCVDQCPSGYVPNRNKYCVCQGQSLMTIHDQCVNLPNCPITMYLDIRSGSCLSCPFGCASCYEKHCTACNPGYHLYISPQIIVCRRSSPLFPCDKQYEWKRDNVCHLKDFTNPALAMTLCVLRISRCSICLPGNQQICVLCEPGFYLLENQCVQNCTSPLVPYENVCILSEIENCSVPFLLSIHHQTVFTLDLIESSDAYKYYIYDGIQRENDPVGYIPYTQKLRSRNHDGWPRQSDFFQPKWTCLKCEKGFGLNEDSSRCLPCPNTCEQKMCYKARTDSCLKTPIFESQCGIDTYIDSETGKCLQSCKQEDKYPQIEKNKLYCKPLQSSGTKDYLKIDSAVYSLQDQTKIVFFVFNNQLQKSQKVDIQFLGGKVRNNFRKVSQSEEQQMTPNQTQIIDGEYIYIDEQNLPKTYSGYELNLSQNLLNLKSEKNLIFPNKVYGTQATQDHRVFMKSWLAYIGYIMAITILFLHFIFIGMELLYKMDNLIIFAQSIYYFSFVKNLVGRLLAQYYYGWSFMHVGFMPNLFEGIIPDHYVEFSAPPSFKLVNMDGNYFRNAGFSLAWMLIYLACFFLVTYIVWVISKALRKQQIWYPRIARQAFFGGIQFFMMNLMFFSVTQLQYSQKRSQGFEGYYDRSQALAIISIVFLSLYTVIRYFLNPLAGIYCLKRILIPLVLALAYNKPVLVVAIIVIELVFAFVRLRFENPQDGFPKYSIFGEGVLIIGGYLLLFLCLDGGVNAIIISIIIFIFIVYLAYDLTTIYLQSRNQYLEDDLIVSWEEKSRSEREMMGYNSRRQSQIYSNTNKWA